MKEQTKEAIAATAKAAERLAEETIERPWVRALSKVGFLAKGILFLVIGSSAVLLAAGLKGGRITDPVGAMAAIAQFSAGKFLLALLIIGAFGHGFWNILRGAADVDNVGKGIKGIVARSASVGIGIFYLLLGVIAFQIVVAYSVPEENGHGEEFVGVTSADLDVLYEARGRMQPVRNRNPQLYSAITE